MGFLCAFITKCGLQALADLLYTFAILHFDAQQMVDSILRRILFDLKSMSPAALSQLVFCLHLLNHRCVRVHSLRILHRLFLLFGGEGNASNPKQLKHHFAEWISGLLFHPRELSTFT